VRSPAGRPVLRGRHPAIVDTLGIENVLFSSDFPHAEGLADPSSFVNELPGFAPIEIMAIRRDNALSLLG
jgi:hypothetical protein